MGVRGTARQIHQASGSRLISPIYLVAMLRAKVPSVLAACRRAVPAGLACGLQRQLVVIPTQIQGERLVATLIITLDVAPAVITAHANQTMLTRIGQSAADLPDPHTPHPQEPRAACAYSTTALHPMLSQHASVACRLGASTHTSNGWCRYRCIGLPYLLSCGQGKPCHRMVAQSSRQPPQPPASTACRMRFRCFRHCFKSE